MTRFHEVVLKPRNLPHVMHFTGPTGANCVEAAIKLARKYTGRYAVAAFTNAFHGMSMGALSVTGSRSARSSVEAGLQGVIRLPYDGYSGAGVADLERFHQMARDPSGGIDELAAVIVETVQGEGGLNVASIAWLRKLREICTSLGALLIVDDIQAGCGRTGTFFSFERAGIVPDLVCLSKSLSGFGLPMSMLLIDPDYDVWKPGEHNGTFRGNALSFVAAARAVDFWEDPKFQVSIGARAKIIDAWMKKMLARFPDLLSRQKGLGLMAGFEFFSSDAAQAVAEKVRQRGVLIERCGPHDEVLKLLPPINIDCDVLDEGLRCMDAAFEDAAPFLSRVRRSKAA
jgi:diaminobutyrate-2-oxoglutarate transaminase